MLDISQFDQVFHPDVLSHASGKHTKDVARAKSKRPLLFHSLLDQLHLGQLRKLYPSHDTKSLRNLHAEVVKATIPTHHKQALLFYVLCDLRGPGGDADRFAEACHLPKQYVIAILGFWEMDRGEYRAALEHLTQPSLLPTFAPEILLQLLKNSKDPALPLAYYHAVSPPLALRSEVRTEYFKFLARIDVQQAFFASRGAPDAHELFDLIVETVLTGTKGSERASAAISLVDLPLSPQEDAWLEQYLSGKGSEAPGAVDTLIMRRVAMGRGADDIGREGQTKGRKVGGLDWHVLTGKLERAT